MNASDLARLLGVHPSMGPRLLTGLEVFRPDVFYMERIPLSFSPYDLLFIIVPTVLASLAASIVPAYRAARKEPVVALRYE